MVARKNRERIQVNKEIDQRGFVKETIKFYSHNIDIFYPENATPHEIKIAEIKAKQEFRIKARVGNQIVVNAQEMSRQCLKAVDCACEVTEEQRQIVVDRANALHDKAGDYITSMLNGGRPFTIESP